jgi:hypothetical protein
MSTESGEMPPSIPPAASRKRANPRKPAGQSDALFFALLSLVSFLAGLLLLWLLVAKAEMLVRLGLEGKLYYLVLLPLGLAVTGFLFGVLRSFALYRGKVLGGALELGGPVVAFGLVVLGGSLLVPPSEPLSVTVFVHGYGGVQDVPLRGKGYVVLDLGPDRRREAIGAKGEAFFPGIPASFRGQDVPIWLEADGFAPADSSVRHRLTGSSLYLAVKLQALKLRGRVQDPEGRPIAEASLRLRNLAATSGTDGSFSVEIPGSLLQEFLSLSASAPGYESWHESVVPGSNDVVVVLRRATQ